MTTNATTTTIHQSFILKFDFDFHSTTVGIYDTIHQDECVKLETKKPLT